MKIIKRDVKTPILAFVILPLIILLVLLILYLLLGKCLVDTSVYKRVAAASESGTEVLGVTSFSLDGSKLNVDDNETFDFVATIVTDSSPVINGTIVFDLTGQGRIESTIEGPGLCVKITELKATCTAVNIAANQTATWEVPVTAKDTCSEGIPASLSMVGSISVAPQVFEDTGIVTCGNEAADDDGTTTGNGTGTTTGGTTTGSTTGTDDGLPDTGEEIDEVDDAFVDDLVGRTGNGDLLKLLNAHNAGIMQCYTNNMLYVVLGLMVLLLLGLLSYFMTGRESETVISEKV